MSNLPENYLDYPLRRYGMDHERYEWSMLPQRPPVAWPQQARVALWVVPALEWFPLDMKGQPFKPPGAMQTAYPDFRHYTLRDYGNRVGIFRIMQALERHGIPASVAMNAAVAVRYPALVQACVKRGWEVIANGLDMDHLHHGGLAEADERALIQQSIEILQQASGQKIRGWLSPAKSESWHTPDLLREAGVEYACDWVNDDMPYPMNTRGGTLYAMPHPIDIDDATILVQNHHTEDDFRDQLIDQFDLLYREARPGDGRVMAISLHPWVIGQPYRIRALEEALAHIMRHQGVWAATGGEILDAWKSAQPTA
ncbi:MAG: polysaccharide deacetylase family protein [Ottowia sp.]|uniref:polysaccharide deacetylase family protein n=1 Tax=Ottowia sp. TaxID=1898956 RepID=UPI003C76EE08